MSSYPITEKLNHLPDHPGVYKYYDQGGGLLYIGKAKSLKKRVRSYFQPSAKHNQRIGLMVSLVYDLETILTNSEAEALILEAQQIKDHQPRYNVALKDDKSYPYFKLTKQETYPRLFLVREKMDKVSEYYGPYTSVRDARAVLNLVNKLFQLRTSKMDLDGSKVYRPCLNYQLKRCLAPCRGNISVEQYNKEIKQVRMFFQGKYTELINDLNNKMEQASAATEYEKAARLRDQTYAVQRTFEKQLLLSPANENIDIYGFHREANFAGIQTLFIRHGRLLATDFFLFEDAEKASNDNLLGQILNRIYMGDSFIIPQKILLPFYYSDQDILAKTLSRKINRKVSILIPQKGDKKKMMEMAYQNAKTNLAEKSRQKNQNLEILLQTQKLLHLDRPPVNIEAFDISNISGYHTVASMVCWKNNQAYKEGYRKFKIQSVEGPDDFSSMREVLTRRYKRSASGEQPLPDLILIDGGKGQLSQAVKVLGDLGINLDQVDVIGLAKGRSEKKRGVKRAQEEDFEYVVKPNQKNEIRLNRHSSVLFLLQNVRDESHRFAITYHRSLRRKSTLQSVLDEIDGVGKQRKKELLKHFGSLKKIKNASLEDLKSAPGVSDMLAQNIYGFLKKIREDHF